MPLLPVRRAPVLLVDTLLALAVVAFDQYAIRQPWDDGHRAGSVALNAPLIALAVLPLAIRRTRPRLALVSMVLLGAGPGLLVDHDQLFWGGFLPLLLVVYTVARADDGAFAKGVWLTGIVLYPFGVWHDPELRSLNELGFGLLATVSAWAIGRVMRGLDRQEEELSAALVEVAEQSGAREAAAVVDERTRIAGEMHDVVAHAVSLMVLQVGAARLEVETGGTSPQAAAQLRSAETAGRDALDQLRRSLLVLRGGPT